MQFPFSPIGRFPRLLPINVDSPASRFGLKLAFSRWAGVGSNSRFVKGLARPVWKSDKA